LRDFLLRAYRAQVRIASDFYDGCFSSSWRTDNDAIIDNNYQIYGALEDYLRLRFSLLSFPLNYSNFKWRDSNFTAA
jgi:hypothetical protein